MGRTAVSLAAALLLAGSPAAAADEAADAVVARLTAASDQLSFRLLRQQAAAAPGSNLLLLAPAVSWSLALLANGASPEVEAEVEQALGLAGLTRDEVNRGASRLRTALGLARSQPGTGEPPAEGLTSETSLWREAPWPADFTQVARTHFDVQLRTLPPGRSGRTAMEVWARDTAGAALPATAPDLAPAGAFSLSGVTRFSGRWVFPFSRHGTRPAPFHLAGGGKRDVPLMHLEAKLRYRATPELQVVDLRYQDAGVSMVVLLPAPGIGVSGLLARLDAAAWAAWTEKQEYRRGRLALPRFKARHELDGARALGALGMRRTFEQQPGAFPRLDRQGAFLTSARMRSEIEVNEVRTVATSSWEVDGVPGAAEALDEFVMTVDRPFLFALRHDATGLLLFLGIVEAPE